MKILWVGPNFLHPTTKGGQIRSLHTLIQLHKRHEVHYVTLDHAGDPEGPDRAGEYSSHCLSFPKSVPVKGSLPFFGQLVSGLFSSVPVSIRRFTADGLQRYVADAVRDPSFDCIVCDFLAVAENFASLNGVALFEHNVESEIWLRRVKQASDPLSRFYLDLQAKRMVAFEKRACLDSDLVIAVSDKDSETMQSWFGVSADAVRAVPTGVDLDYFQRPADRQDLPQFDLVFVGSMDWSPNEDAMQCFVADILPLIRQTHPACSVAIVGRSPSEALRGLAEGDPAITVTGTVPDVRPYLWGARASIVPIRIGGGTRLKIYESAAAGTPVLSTTVGAEGLALEDDKHILLADDAPAFAQKAANILDDSALRDRIAADALQLVAAEFSWASVALQFEEHLVEASRRRSAFLNA